jgi:hypothetical protein
MAICTTPSAETLKLFATETSYHMPTHHSLFSCDDVTAECSLLLNESEIHGPNTHLSQQQVNAGEMPRSKQNTICFLPAREFVTVRNATKRQQESTRVYQLYTYRWIQLKKVV